MLKDNTLYRDVKREKRQRVVYFSAKPLSVLPSSPFLLVSSLHLCFSDYRKTDRTVHRTFMYLIFELPSTPSDLVELKTYRNLDVVTKKPPRVDSSRVHSQVSTSVFIVKSIDPEFPDENCTNPTTCPLPDYG